MGRKKKITVFYFFFLFCKWFDLFYGNWGKHARKAILWFVVCGVVCVKLGRLWFPVAVVWVCGCVCVCPCYAVQAVVSCFALSSLAGCGGCVGLCFAGCGLWGLGLLIMRTRGK